MKKLRQLGFTTQIVILMSVVLFLANILLGTGLYSVAKKALKENVESRMLDIANSAAKLVDGDIYKTLEAEDADTEGYRHIYDTLGAFQQSIEMEYIYGVREMEDGRFVFTVDPEPVDPGTFGQEIVRTDALVAASRGTPSVDKEPYTDEWGAFYSAYSPIYDSAGEIVGLVAVDFSPTWYENQLKKITMLVIIGSVISMIMGALIVFLLTRRLRQRFKDLTDDVGVMAKELNKLIHEAKGEADSGMAADEIDAEKASRDYIDRVKVKMAFMHMELRNYFDYVKKQAYLDGMTGVPNKTAYLERMQRLNTDIGDGKADFEVVIFDINGLKKVNDNHGHEEGDRVINAAATALTKAYGEKNIYRIGGDEFIAVLEGDAKEPDDGFAKLDEAIAETNAEVKLILPLAISRGRAEYNAGEDRDFNSVFKRADDAMYRNKAEYYIQHGDRRRRRDE